MENIELVIKLDEELYRYIKRYYNVSSTLTLRDMDMCMNAIINGKPLPKGHGVLKDADELLKQAHIIGTSNYCEYDVVYVETIKEAPTIIEKDKEQEYE